MFRINYGNGQVSGTFKTARAARAELDMLRASNTAHTDSMRIQRYEGDGEWSTLRTAAT